MNGNVEENYKGDGDSDNAQRENIERTKSSEASKTIDKKQSNPQPPKSNITDQTVDEQVNLRLNSSVQPTAVRPTTSKSPSVTSDTEANDVFSQAMKLASEFPDTDPSTIYDLLEQEGKNGREQAFEFVREQLNKTKGNTINTFSLYRHHIFI